MRLAITTMKTCSRRAVVLAVIAGAVTGCARGDGDASHRQSEGDERRGTVLLLAASSTTDATTQAVARFEAQHGTTVRVSAGSSNALASQIIAGVPAGVYLAANEQWVDVVDQRSLIAERTPLLSNRLVIVVPRGNPGGVTSPADLVGPSVRHVALAGEQVPAGIYAGQALAHAAVLDDLVATGRVARGQNVRLTLSYVETGEAEAGVVYATDARASAAVEVVYTFSPDAHDPIIYTLARLRSPQGDAATGVSEYDQPLYDFLRGDEALAVFEAHGFVRAPRHVSSDAAAAGQESAPTAVTP